jgi:purine catabolism regulator
MIVSLMRFLQSDLFKHAEIIAGQGGANNPVKAINIMDAPDGPMYMKEGTLCITTGYAWLEDPEVQKKLIEDLKKQNVAGLGIMMRFFGGTLPDTLQKTADDLDMPIVSIDDHLVYTDIIMYFANHVYCQALDTFMEKRRLSEQLMSHIGDKSMRGLVHELNELFR